MELKEYWRIARRRFWIILALLVSSALTWLLFPSRTAPSYAASMRFVVGVRPESSQGKFYTYDRYYTWLTAEYLVDDLAEVVKSRAFAQDVASLAGVDIPPGAIQGATSAGKLHRILTVQIHWGNREELERIANATANVLLHQSAKYFAQLSTENAVVSLIDPPQVGLVGPSLRQRLDLPLRLVFALVLGILLAFLWDYFDDTIRDRQDLESLGLPILAEVPAKHRFLPRQRSLP